MPDRLRSWEVGVERVGHQLERDCASGQRGGLIHDLLVVGVLDPELSEVGADAVDGAFIQAFALAIAGLVDGELDGRRTAIQDENRQG